MLEEKQGSLCGLAVSWRGSRWGTREVGVSMGAMDLSVHGGGGACSLYAEGGLESE